MTKKGRVVDSITLLVNSRMMQLIDEIIRMCFNISQSFLEVTCLKFTLCPNGLFRFSCHDAPELRIETKLQSRPILESFLAVSALC